MGFAISDMQLKTSAFENNGDIPVRHTGIGDDISPAFSWTNAPEGTRSFALFCHDPDAPLVTPAGNYGFVHWVLYNIPGHVKELPEACEDYTAGKNNFEKQSYNGPLPPEGHGDHRYYFWLLALDVETSLEPGLELADFLKAVEPNILGMNRLVGSFRRD